MEYTDGSIKLKTVNMLGVIPTGAVIPFAGDNVPNGFLLCNGQTVSRKTYQELFEIIGIKYGAGDGSTTFNVPNLTERFVQGGTQSGEVREAGLPNIIGRFWTRIWSDFVSRCTGAFTATIENPTGDYGTNTTNYKNVWVDIDASKCSPIYGESGTVQPPAIIMMYIIKY